MLSSGATALLYFLTQKSGRTRQCWWSQKRIADQMHCSVRTIGRWVSELRLAGLLDSIRRGSTSNLYTLSSACGKSVEDVRTDQPKCPNVDRPSLLLNLRKEKQLALPFPQATVTNEYGRTDPNPEYVAIIGILRGARQRIERARNPIAYEHAIVQRELAAMRKPNVAAGSPEYGGLRRIG